LILIYSLYRKKKKLTDSDTITQVMQLATVAQTWMRMVHLALNQSVPMNLYSQITNTQIEYTFALSLLCRLLYVMLHEKHIQLSGLCGSWSSSYVLVYHPVFQTKFRRSSRSSSGGLCSLYIGDLPGGTSLQILRGPFCKSHDERHM
jgi:hypothetical protein